MTTSSKIEGKRSLSKLRTFSKISFLLIEYLHCEVLCSCSDSVMEPSKHLFVKKRNFLNVFNVTNCFPISNKTVWHITQQCKVFVICFVKRLCQKKTSGTCCAGMISPKINFCASVSILVVWTQDTLTYN